jgi:hypothetical protein
MPRDPKDLWNDLLAEAGESEIDEAASISVEQAERDLAAAGFDVQAERAKAAAFLDELEGKPATPARAAASARARRRPRAAVLWLAAAAAATATGGLLYAALHTPAPAPPPSPSSPPSTPTLAPPPPAPLLLSAVELRHQAQAALDAGRPLDCLDLLEQARQRDPAGDDTPDMKKLRAAAVRAMKP